jgi:hypothetical protein
MGQRNARQDQKLALIRSTRIAITGALKGLYVRADENIALSLQEASCKPPSFEPLAQMYRPGKKITRNARPLHSAQQMPPST